MTSGLGRRRTIVRGALSFGIGFGAFIAGLGATSAYRAVTAPAATPAPRIDQRTVANLRVATSTAATPVASGSVVWIATWTLCWDPIPGAVGYEVQPMTAESASARLKRVETPCFSVDIAAGEDRPSDLQSKRDVQIAMQRSQLSYRVRADFGGNVVSAWSPAIDAGATGVR